MLTMKDILKTIIIAIIILILIAINLKIFISNNQNKEKQSTTENSTIIANYRTMTIEEEAKQVKNDTEKIVSNKIAAMSEGDRAKAYFAKFLDAIEEKDYKKAYSYLNENYKKQYFPEINDFEKYVKTEFPANSIVVDYNSIERKGEIFVMSVKLNDVYSEQETQKIRTVVIREKEINQFTISFAV